MSLLQNSTHLCMTFKIKVKFKTNIHIGWGQPARQWGREGRREGALALSDLSPEVTTVMRLELR